MKASVLAIGTEITSGQIFNKNASRISELIKVKGVESIWHLSVPDNKKLILDALSFLLKDSDLLFVTGGLGPTSDDFTRDVLAEFFNLQMHFDSRSFEQIKKKFASRNYPLREMHKQQCYFPAGAQVLDNRVGTANGFYFTKDKKHVFVLPGPPKEIESIWKDHIDTMMVEMTKNIDPLVTVAWDTLGLGESEIANRVVPIFENFQKNNRTAVDIGYRVHIPYVEVKLSYYRSHQSEVQGLINFLEAELKSFTVLRNGEDVVRSIVCHLEKYSELVIIDNFSQGHFLNRLAPIVKEVKTKISFFSNLNWLNKIELQSSKDVLLFQLNKISENSVVVSIESESQKNQEEILLDQYSHYPLERKTSLCVELSLLILLRELKH